MNLATTTTTVRNIANEAGEIAKRYFKHPDLESHSKGGSDFVTKADLEVDAFLRDALGKEFPGSKFLTEETAPADFSALKDIDGLWIIDPIDGTTNFSRADEHFSISIAYTDRGNVTVAVVYLPLEKKMYWANAEEEMAYCDDDTISVSQLSDLQSVSVGYDWAWDLSDRERMQQWVGKFMKTIRQPRALGCASADMAKVANGELDGYINIGIKPWDVAAASLLVEKSGGMITKADGAAWSIFDKDILVTNTHIHEAILALLRS